MLVLSSYVVFCRLQSSKKWVQITAFMRINPTMGRFAQILSRLLPFKVSGWTFAHSWVFLAFFLTACSPEDIETVARRAPIKAEAKAESQVDKPAGPEWQSLAEDGIHDPSNPAIRLLQQPAEALSALPRAQEGNQVDWVAALRNGDIQPRTNIFPETKIRVLDLDILMEDTAGKNMVLFPHRPHTEWLDCKNCHDRIFVAKRGANSNINMLSILQGNACGQCHGAVSFPLTQCERCHSVPRSSVGK